MSEYLSIKAFAEKAGVSGSAIYQQMEGRLKPYVSIVKGKRRISSDALKEFYNFKSEAKNSSKLEGNLNESKPDPKENSSQLEKTLENNSSQLEKNISENSSELEIMRSMIQALQEQLKIKDSQIASLQKQLEVKDKQISDYSEGLRSSLQIAHGSQYVLAADKTAQLAQLTEKKATDQAENETKENEQPKKKSFFNRLLKK